MIFFPIYSVLSKNVFYFSVYKMLRYVSHKIDCLIMKLRSCMSLRFFFINEIWGYATQTFKKSIRIWGYSVEILNHTIKSSGIQVRFEIMFRNPIEFNRCCLKSIKIWRYSNANGFFELLKLMDLWDCLVYFKHFEIPSKFVD